MKTKDFTTITLKDFLDRGDHAGFSKVQIIQMAAEQLKRGEDYMHIVRGECFRIQQGSIGAILNPPEVVPEPVVEPPKPAEAPRPPITPSTGAKRVTAKGTKAPKRRNKNGSNYR